MWPWLTPLQAGLLLTLSWIGTLLLYRLRPRPRRVAVAFLPLWEAALGPDKSARLRSRWGFTLSWLVACIVTTLLILSVLAPSTSSPGQPAASRLIILQAGQHMRATDLAPSRFTAAREQARALVAAKAPGERVMIAALDTQVTALSPLTSDSKLLDQALARAEPADTEVDTSAAVRFALQLLRGQAHAVLTLIGDGSAEVDATARDALHAAQIQLEQRRVGQRTGNLAIRRLSARRYSWDQHRCELLLELDNAQDQACACEVTVYANGAPIAVTTIEVAAQARATKILTEVATDAERIEARIDAGDALPDDDHAYAVLPPVTRRQILLVSEGNRYLEAALLLDSAFSVERVAPTRYQRSDGYDLVIFDRTAPAQAPNAPSLYLAPPDGVQFPLPVRGSVQRPFFDLVDRSHPILRDVALRDANLASAQRLEPSANDEVLASTSAHEPLIVTGTRAERAFIAFAFDLARTDLALRVAWPVLLLRSVEFLCGVTQDYRASLVAGVGQSLQLPLPDGVAWLSGPGLAREQPISVQRGRVWLRLRRAGFYVLRAGEERQVLAVNRNATLPAAITPRPQLDSAHVIKPPRPSRTTPPLPALALWLAWALLFAEWVAFQRRWTQ